MKKSEYEVGYEQAIKDVERNIRRLFQLEATKPRIAKKERPKATVLVVNKYGEIKARFLEVAVYEVDGVKREYATDEKRKEAYLLLRDLKGLVPNILPTTAIFLSSRDVLKC